MKLKTYQKTLFKISAIVLVLTTFLSCKDNENIIHPNPQIFILVKPAYVYSDTTLSVGQTIKIAIEAQYNSYNKLTNFIAKVNNKRYLDLGMYAETYTRELSITKGIDDIENWEFIIRDIEGNSSSVELTINKNQVINYGKIIEYNNVKLGAQNNTQYGSFLSLSNGQVYKLEQAFNNSSLIDIAAYYDNFDKLEEWIMASPGANIGDAFPGTYAINNWESINTTRYSREKLDVPVQEFDNAQNDSILIANTFAFDSGGRKSKYLETGDMYSFVRDGRTGIFKVLGTSGTTGGHIIVDIKIQK